jgi:hypothetical protein
MTSISGVERDQLRRELEEARKELLASFQGLTQEQMTRPGVAGDWSVKDVLSHVTSWEEIALPDLARLARGDKAVLASIDLYSANYDPMNAVIMSMRRNLPLDQVLRELHIFHADFVAGVARLPDSVIQEGQFGWLFVKITAEHDHEHAGHISEWRKREAL